MGDLVETSRRARADFRIQRKDDFKKIVEQERYHGKRIAQESSTYRRFMHKIIHKKVGKVISDWGADLLEAINKGYPLNFTNYDTYDSKRERTYERQLKKHRANRRYFSDI